MCLSLLFSSKRTRSISSFSQQMLIKNPTGVLQYLNNIDTTVNKTVKPIWMMFIEMIDNKKEFQRRKRGLKKVNLKLRIYCHILRLANADILSYTCLCAC